MSQATIPDLPFIGTPLPSTILFEISNSGVSQSTDLDSIIFDLENVQNKDQPNGYAGLDGSGQLNPSTIPDISGTYQILTEKDVANGYAGLDATGLLLLGTIPNLPQSRTIDLETDLADRELLANKVTTVGTPGNDTNYPTEKATRDALDLKQDTLLFTPEDIANKVTSVGTPGNDTNYPSEKAVRDALDLKEDSLGFTPENIINKVTVIGTPGNDTNYPTEKASRDALDLKEDSLGFTPENVANKSVNFTSPNDTKYPTTQATVTELLNYQLLSGKGAVSGYAGLDASQELLITNFPSGTALQVLRRNAGNTALEFADVAAGGSQTPWTSNIDGAGFALLDVNYLEVGSSLSTPFADAGTIRMPDQATIEIRQAGDAANNIILFDDLEMSFEGWNSYVWNDPADFDFGSATFTGIINLEVSGGASESIDFGDTPVFSIATMQWSASNQDQAISLGNVEVISWEKNAGTGYAGISSIVTNEFVIGFSAASPGALVPEYTFSETLADFKANTLANVSSYITAATFPADAGAIRLGDLEQISFRNSSNDGNFTITSDDPTLTFKTWETIEFPEATIIEASLADLQILTIDMSGDIAMNGFNLNEVGVILSNAGAPADGGFLRMGNGETLSWRNFGDSANANLSYSTSDQFLFNSAINVSNNLIKAVLSPVDGTDAANKTYVDNLVNGLVWKDAADQATTSNITLSGEQTIDGILTSASRVLVKDQTLGEDNGVYTTGAGAWTRTTDTDTDVELNNMSIFISNGTVNAGSSWTQTTDLPITVGTTVLVYAQIGAGSINPLTTKGDIYGYDTGSARIPVGTDGQQLVANSAVALGVEWQTVGSPLIAKGDLFTFTTLDARLPVGITGQILSANAALSTGLEWIDNDASPLTSKGDIYTFTTVNERIAVGTNGQVLSANAAQPTGLEWITLPVAGDVVGPAGATDNAIARYDLATGKLIQNTGVLIDDNNRLTVPAPIVLTAAGTVPPGTETYFREVSNDLIVNVATAQEMDFNFGTTTRVTFTQSGIDLLTNDLAQATITSSSSLNATQVLSGLAYGNGIKQVFNPSSANAGLNVGAQADPDPSAPVNGDIYYNSTNNKFRAYENAVWVDLIGGGGSQTPWTSDIAAATFNLSNFGVLSFDTPATSDPGVSDSISMQTGTFTNDMHFHVTSGTGEYHFFIGATSPADFIINNNSVSMDFKSLNGLTGIRGTNDLKILDIVTLASTVNNLQITGATTGNGPLIESEGTDTNVDIRLSPKGFADGSVHIQSRALKMDEINTPTAPPANDAKFYPKNVGGRSHLFIQDDVGEVDLNLTGGGDVTGPASSVDNEIAIYDSTTGKIIQNNGASAQPVTISDEAYVSGIRALTFSGFNTTQGTGLHWIQYANSNLQFNVSVGGYKFDVAGSVLFQLTASSALFTDLNLILNDNFIQTTESAGDPGSPGATNNRLYTKDVSGRSHLFIRDDVGEVDIQSGGGDVSGPASAVNHNLAVFDGTTGKLIDGAGSTGFEIIVDAAGQPTFPRAIIFTNVTVQPSASDPWIEAYFSDITMNVSTGNEVHIAIQSATSYTFDATEFNTINHNIALGTAYMDIGEITTPALPSADRGRLYTKDVSTETHLFFINSSGTDIDLSAGSEDLVWSADHSADRFNFVDIGALVFDLLGPTSVPATTNPYIAYDTVLAPDGLTINVPAVRLINFAIAGVSEFEFRNSQMDAKGNNVVGAGFFRTTAGANNDSGGLQLGNNEFLSWRNASNSNDHHITFNASDEFVISVTSGTDYSFSESTFNVGNNNITALGRIEFNTSGTQPASTINSIWATSDNLNLQTAVADEINLYVGNVLEYQFSNSIFDGLQNILRNFSQADIQSTTTPIVQINNTDSTPSAAQSLGFLRFRGDRTASSAIEYAEFETIMVDPSAGSADGELIIKVVNANTLAEYITLNEGGAQTIHFKKNLQDFTMDPTTGSAQINGLEGLVFTNDATVLGAGSSFIQKETTNLILNVPTANGMLMTINGVTEFEFNATELDINGNNIINVQDIVHDQSLITFNATLAFDFDQDQEQTLAVTGDLTTLTTTNRAAGKSKSIFITGDTVNRTLTFNASWRTNPSTATVTITANTFGILTFGCQGGAETDVFCAYAEFV